MAGVDPFAVSCTKVSVTTELKLTYVAVLVACLAPVEIVVVIIPSLECLCLLAVG